METGKRHLLFNEEWCRGSWQCLGPLMQRDLLQLLHGNISWQDRGSYTESVAPLSCSGAHGVLVCTGTRVLQQGRHWCCSAKAGESCRETATGEQTNSGSCTQSWPDRHGFPHEKVIEISAAWDTFSLGLPVTTGNWGWQPMSGTGPFPLCSTGPGKGTSSHGWNGILLNNQKVSAVGLWVFSTVTNELLGGLGELRWPS